MPQITGNGDLRDGNLGRIASAGRGEGAASGAKPATDGYAFVGKRRGRETYEPDVAGVLDGGPGDRIAD